MVESAVEGKGSVEISPDQAEYKFGSEIELTANPDQNWEFSEWSGDISKTDNPLAITVNDAFTITAIFSNTTFAGGNGTEANPYKISTLEQLQAISENPEANFVQINDIDASTTANWNNGKGFNPIGVSANRFKGTFDGQNHKISNLFINRMNAQYVGLFGIVEGVSSDEVVILKNLNLLNIKLRGGSITGGLVGGANRAMISNVAVEGEILKGKGQGNVGGLAGSLSNTKVADSYSKGIVRLTNQSGPSGVGGLVGGMGAGEIKRSFSESNVIGGGSIGGLFGRLNSVKVSSCYAAGDVEVDKTVMASFVGSSEAGGFTGYYEYGEINDSYSLGDVTGGEGFTGGFIGVDVIISSQGPNTQIENTYSAGNVSGDGDTGGYIGSIWGQIENNYWLSSTSNNAVGVYQSEDHTDGIIPLNEVEMTGSAARDNMTGFDFNNIWITTDGYPILRWQ